MHYELAKLLEIVEETQFSDELERLISDPIRADEFVDGAKFMLARQPRIGTHIGNNVWFLPMSGESVSLYYSFDRDHVYLLSIVKTSEEELEEE